MERIKMNFAQFAEYVSNLKGCQFVNVFALTTAEMNKGRGANLNPYYGRVQKFTATPMQVGYDYENAVNNRLEREGKERSFSAERLPWGEWVTLNKVITHKGMLYLRTYCVRKSHPKTFYLLDGELATAEQYNAFAPYLKGASTSTKQEACGLEEEYQVKPRDYKFSSILAITMNGTRITLVEE